MSAGDPASTPYFFLSYAHSYPLDGDSGVTHDDFVQRFFNDLSDAVRRHASSGDVSGFCDQVVPLGSDWKQSITGALSTAQVFVPLYSMGYLTSSWPGRELTSFRNRVRAAGRADPVHRIVPVLWAPLAGLHDPPGLHAAMTADATETDYADNGLLALLRLRHDDAYLAVVDRLATRIVELAEVDPIEPVQPSRIGDIEMAPSDFATGRPLPIFVIEVAAPTVANVPQGRGPAAYGETPEQWRPFPGQELPLAEYARHVAERFDFAVRVDQVREVPDQREPGGCYRSSSWQLVMSRWLLVPSTSSPGPGSCRRSRRAAPCGRSVRWMNSYPYSPD
jgi:hypothetical protein